MTAYSTPGPARIINTSLEATRITPYLPGKIPDGEPSDPGWTVACVDKSIDVGPVLTSWVGVSGAPALSGVRLIAGGGVSTKEIEHASIKTPKRLVEIHILLCIR